MIVELIYQLLKTIFIKLKKNEYGLASDMYMKTSLALKKLEKDLNLEKKINEIKNFLSEKSYQDKTYIDNYSLLELHCTAICIDLKTKRVLIFKRTEKRNRLKNLWEFGCTRATTDLTLTQSLVTFYKDSFGLDIEPILLDKDRKDIEPMPLAIYNIQKDDDNHKGFITIAKIVDDYDINKFKSNNKYSEVKWISKKDINLFNDNDTIPDFKSSLNLAFKYLEDNNLFE